MRSHASCTISSATAGSPATARTQRQIGKCQRSTSRSKAAVSPSWQRATNSSVSQRSLSSRSLITVSHLRSRAAAREVHGRRHDAAGQLV